VIVAKVLWPVTIGVIKQHRTTTPAAALLIKLNTIVPPLSTLAGTNSWRTASGLSARLPNQLLKGFLWSSATLAAKFLSKSSMSALCGQHLSI
jgi:hypothetical protein